MHVFVCACVLKLHGGKLTKSAAHRVSIVLRERFEKGRAAVCGRGFSSVVN